MELYLPWIQMTVYDHIVGFLLCILAPILIMGSRKPDEAELQTESQDRVKLYHSNGLFLLVVSMIVITIWRLPGRSLAEFGFATPVWSENAWRIVGLIVVFYLGDLFLQYGLKRWRESSLKKIKTSLSFLPTGVSELTHFSFLSLSAGFGEEVLFRAFLLHYLVFWIGNSPAEMLVCCAASSLLFAYLHGYQGFQAMVKIFFLSVMFSLLFILTKSLFPVMILHAMIDIAGGFIGVQLVKMAGEESGNGSEN